jgi:hypothetical protein
MTLMLVLAAVLIIALLGSLPIWPHSRSWGYYPVGVGVILLIILIMFFTGHLHAR